MPCIIITGFLRSQTISPIFGSVYKLVLMDAPKPEFHYEELSIFDVKNPSSLINALPKSFGDRIKELDKQWFNYSAAQLRGKCHPTNVEHQLRLAFWHEYNQSQENGHSMRLANVYSPCCTKDYFYRVIFKQDSKLAWLINPPAEYQIQVEEMLHLGLSRLREVLELPIFQKRPVRGGKLVNEPNTKLISEMVKIVALLDNRVKGAVIQRMAIQQQSYNVNVNQEMGREGPKSVGEIDKELRQVSRQIREIEAPYKKDLIRELSDSGGESEEVIGVEATPIGSNEE